MNRPICQVTVDLLVADIPKGPMAIPQHLRVAPGPLEPLRQDVPGLGCHVPWRHIEFLQLQPHRLEGWPRSIVIQGGMTGMKGFWTLKNGEFNILLQSFTMLLREFMVNFCNWEDQGSVWKWIHWYTSWWKMMIKRWVEWGAHWQWMRHPPSRILMLYHQDLASNWFNCQELGFERRIWMVLGGRARWSSIVCKIQNTKNKNSAESRWSSEGKRNGESDLSKRGVVQKNRQLSKVVWGECWVDYNPNRAQNWISTRKTVSFHLKKNGSTISLGLLGSPSKNTTLFGKSHPAKGPRMTRLPAWNPPHRTCSVPSGVHHRAMPRWHHESSAGTVGRRSIFGPPRCRPPYLGMERATGTSALWWKYNKLWKIIIFHG